MVKTDTDMLKLLDITDRAGAATKPAAPATGNDDDMLVTLHFSLALENGDLIDSTFEGRPATFRRGDGSLPAAFENFACALAPGESRSVTLEPEQAFGLPSEENVRDYAHYQFPADMALEEGLMVSFKDSAGNEQAGVVSRIGRQTVTVDFNHPLAGRRIIFTAEVLDRVSKRD